MKPEAIQTEAEQLETLGKKMDMGLISRAEAIADMRKVPIERAKELVEEIDDMEIPEIPANMGSERLQ